MYTLTTQRGQIYLLTVGVVALCTSVTGATMRPSSTVTWLGLTASTWPNALVGRTTLSLTLPKPVSTGPTLKEASSNLPDSMVMIAALSQGLM